MVGIALADAGLALAEVRTLSRGADDAGLSTIWIPEVASRDAIVVAGIVGGCTQRARICTGVVGMHSRTPVGLALACATASEACAGRFSLGIGTGHRAAAEGWFGASWRHPRRRLKETIELVRDVFAGDRVWHDGVLHVEGFHLAARATGIEVWVGALTPPSLRLAGEVADGVLLEWMPPDGLAASALLAREAAADAGRDVRVAAYLRVAVADTEDERHEAMAAMRDDTYLYASLPVYARGMRRHGLARAIDRLDGAQDESALDELVDALCVVGSAAEVRERVESLRACGVDEPVAYPVPYGQQPAETVLRALRAIA